MIARGIISGYNGIQGVTRGWGQGRVVVTMGYKGLQGDGGLVARNSMSGTSSCSQVGPDIPESLEVRTSNL